MRTTSVIIGTILILTSVPTVLAQVSTPLSMASGWASKGSYEPSTKYDTQAFMFQTPNTDATQEKVYFNGFEDRSDAVVRTTFTPNLASIGMAHRMTPHDNMAMLGTWLDCNNDGYIGFADHGLLEYRSELLVGPYNTGICPVKAFPTATNPAPTHNDGTWVHEFIPIGYRQDALLPLDRNYYDDAGARVWADGGVPGAPGGYVCFLSPVPTGTYHTVGSMGTYADCLGRGKVSNALSATGTGSTYNSTLAPIHNPWGEESDPSMVTAFDCNQPQLFHKGLTSSNGKETFGVGVSQPTTPAVHPPPARLYQNGDPSLAGTANETVTDVDDCNRANNDGQNDGAVAHLPYSNEGNDVTNQDTNPPIKIRNDPLYYNEAQRLLRTGAQSQDLGTGQTSTQGIWTPFTVGLFDNAFVDVFGPQVSGVVYTTYYAIVPNATTLGLTLPGGGTTATYGSEACGTFVTGHYGGWECDPSKWNWGTQPHAVTIHSVDATATYTDPMRVGRPYTLRDVDCFDESVTALRTLGVGWGIVTAGACT